MVNKNKFQCKLAFKPSFQLCFPGRYILTSQGAWSFGSIGRRTVKAIPLCKTSLPLHLWDRNGGTALFPKSSLKSQGDRWVTSEKWENGCGVCVQYQITWESTISSQHIFVRKKIQCYSIRNRASFLLSVSLSLSEMMDSSLFIYLQKILCIKVKKNALKRLNNAVSALAQFVCKRADLSRPTWTF